LAHILRPPRYQFTLKRKAELVGLYDTFGELPKEKRVKRRRQVLAAAGSNADASIIADWRRQLAVNEGSPSKKPQTAKRMKGGGRKPLLTAEQELEIFKWFEALRSKKRRVGVTMIRLHARKKFGIPATAKWADGWLNRHGITVRRVTTNKEVSTPRMKELLYYFRNKHMDQFQGMSDLLLFNMDETRVNFDMPDNYTLEKKGTKQVEIATTKHELDRVGLALCVDRAGGIVYALVMYKCGEDKKGTRTNKLTFTPVIIPGEDGAEDITVNLWVTHNRKAWLTGQLMIKWLIEIYQPHVEANCQKATEKSERLTENGEVVKRMYTLADSLLIMDNCSTHTSDEVIEALNATTLPHLYLPTNTTPILQPCDQNINQIFKLAVRDSWDKWFSEEGCHKFTVHGNLRKASEADVNKWIAQGIQAITTNIIQQSWLRSCATAKFQHTLLVQIPQRPWLLIKSFLNIKANVKNAPGPAPDVELKDMNVLCAQRHKYQNYKFPERIKRKKKPEKKKRKKKRQTMPEKVEVREGEEEKEGDKAKKGKRKKGQKRKRAEGTAEDTAVQVGRAKNQKDGEAAIPFTSMTTIQLYVACVRAGLATGGKKADRVERLTRLAEGEELLRSQGMPTGRASGAASARNMR
jgi:hypothetical protein